jgi:hypothetical protein
MILFVFCLLLPIAILLYSTSIHQISKMEFGLSTIAVVAIEIPIFVLFYYSKLETIVTNEGLGYRWRPLQNKFRMLFKEDIIKVNTRNGPPFSYGIHWMPSYGWVHNIRGRKGFQINMRSGKRLFIGSQKIDELKSVLETLLNNRIADYRNEF